MLILILFVSCLWKLLSNSKMDLLIKIKKKQKTCILKKIDLIFWCDIIIYSILRFRSSKLIHLFEKIFEWTQWGIKKTFLLTPWSKPSEWNYRIKETVMEIEKALINDTWRVSKESWNFRIPTISNFALIYLWNLLFS